MWLRKGQAAADAAAETPPGEVAARTSKRASRPGYFERRRQRRKRRKIFEEIVAWIVVPAIFYGGYLAYKAVGGLPPAAFEALSEISSMALRGGK